MKSYSYFAPDQNWTDEVIQKLRKQGVIYHKGVHAIRIIERENAEPFFELLGEDDGHLFSLDSNYPHTFSSSWSNDLISVLEDAKEYVNSHPKKYNLGNRKL